MGEAGFPLTVLVNGNYSGSADCRFARFKKHLVFEVTARPYVSHAITFPSHEMHDDDLVDAKMGEKKTSLTLDWSQIYRLEYHRGLGYFDLNQ